MSRCACTVGRAGPSKKKIWPLIPNPELDANRVCTRVKLCLSTGFDYFRCIQKI